MALIDKAAWAAKVTDMAEREEAVRLFEAVEAAQEALKEASYDYRLQIMNAGEAVKNQIKEINRDYRARIFELDAWKSNAIAQALGRPSLAELEAAETAAQAAYEEVPGEILESDVSGRAARCALSGAPLYYDDPTIEIGDHLVLRCLAIPADIAAELEGDSEDSEDGDEEDEAA